jgi:small subunit ribosomal protein S20
VANTSGSKKRARQAVKRNAHNAGLRSMVRTYVKKTLGAIQTGDYEASQAAYVAAVPKIDTMVSKGILRKNKASRWKSRLNSKVKALKA